MAPILKTTVLWSGFTGAPGYSNFYFHVDNPGASWDGGAVLAGDALNTFFTALKPYAPPSLKWRVQSDASVIEASTGELVSMASTGPRADIVGTSVATNYGASQGGVINWRSNGVRNGRRVRGRTFLVPLSATAYTTDGVMAPAFLTAVGNAATALINTAGDLSLAVWARPTGPGAVDGQMHLVNTATIPNKQAVLRSRRD